MDLVDFRICNIVLLSPLLTESATFKTNWVIYSYDKLRLSHKHKQLIVESILRSQSQLEGPVQPVQFQLFSE